MRLILEKRRAGWYAIVGLRCGDCGGAVHIERVASIDPLFRWQTWCTQCGSADPNGWPTLTEARDAAPAYFAPAPTEETAHDQ